ncbi:hypothetical protein Q8F55_004695 [Vanrija albida]|uniref:DUF1996 domain-containing protein n=1 Tax=Vanrija albida TaxID=181172 RepID=A0ABR3Q7P6_9TREE
MFTSSLYSVLAILATGAHVVSAGQFAVDLGALLTARIDPLVDPGNDRDIGHVHTVFGASNFRSQINTPDEMRAAKCTSAVTTADKSNYWVPTLFFKNPEGEYEAAYLQGARAYYNVNPNDKTEPFPDGLRMISGTGGNRAWTEKSIGVAFGTLEDRMGPYLPNNTNTKLGSTPSNQFQYHIRFPSCGNGELDSPDHFSHMAWQRDHNGPTAWGGGSCPESHPIRYPTLTLEVYWTIHHSARERWRKGDDDANLVLANGDEVGGSLHADFIMGWDRDIFSRAIKDEACLNADSDITKCPVFDSTAVHDDSHKHCRYQGQIPSEELGYYKQLKSLPGKNAPWPRGLGDEKPDGSRSDYTKPGWTWPNVAWESAVAFPQWPLAVDFENAPSGAPTQDFLNQFTPILRDNFRPWHALTSNPAGTSEDVKGNRDYNSAPNKVQQVYGL